MGLCRLNITVDAMNQEAFIELVSIVAISIYLFKVDVEDLRTKFIDDYNWLIILAILTPQMATRYFIFGVDIFHLVSEIVVFIFLGLILVINKFYFLIGEADIIMAAILNLAFPILTLNPMVISFAMDSLMLSLLLLLLCVPISTVRNLYYVVNGASPQSVIHVVTRMYDPSSGEWAPFEVPFIPLYHTGMLLTVIVGSPAVHILRLLFNINLPIPY